LRLAVIAALILFTAPVAVALAIVAAWYLTPSGHGRGRHLRPLIAPALGGCIGLAAWVLLSGQSPVADAVLAQVRLLQSVVLGSDVEPTDLLRRWLAGVGPLSFGAGPLLALATGWKISRSRADDSISEHVARLARDGAEHPDDGVLLGFAPIGSSVRLSSRELSAHMLVAGATQAGKSTLVKRHVEGLCRLGHSLLVLDGKADPALAAFLRDLDSRATIWSPGQPVAPLDLLKGNVSEFAAKLIDIHRWTEPHYRAINHRYALQLGAYFALSGEPRTPATVLRLLVPDNLDAAADALGTQLRRASDTARAETALAITTYTADLLRDPTRRLVIAGLADRFAGIVEGALAGCLDDSPGALPLETILVADQPWYMGLPGDTMPDEVAALGAWLLRELARIAHHRRSVSDRAHQAHVIIDELSALGHGALQLEPVLARARDAGISVVVTTQALADVRALSPTLPDQLLANTGVQVFFHMRDREAAWAASALGSGEAERETLSEDENGGVVRRSRRTSTVPLVPAYVLEGFGVGDAMLSVAATATGCERRLERFRVALPGGRARSSPIGAAVLSVATLVLAPALVFATGLLNPPLSGPNVPSNAVRFELTPRAVIRSAIPTARVASVSPVAAVAAQSPTLPQSWRVGDTDHMGVYLRAQPDGSPQHAWPDNTVMEAAGEPAIGRTGEVWQPVRAPDGSTGWVKMRYLLDARGTRSP
jgi:hypothetical protein